MRTENEESKKRSRIENPQYGPQENTPYSWGVLVKRKAGQDCNKEIKGEGGGDMKRREFLKRTLGTAVAAVLPGVGLAEAYKPVEHLIDLGPTPGASLTLKLYGITVAGHHIEFSPPQHYNCSYLRGQDTNWLHITTTTHA